VENDGNDIAAIEAAFNVDFAGTAASGTYQPLPADHLIWGSSIQPKLIQAVVSAQFSVDEESAVTVTNGTLPALNARCPAGIRETWVSSFLTDNESAGEDYGNAQCATVYARLNPNGSLLLTDYSNPAQSTTFGAIGSPSIFGEDGTFAFRDLAIKLTDQTALDEMEHVIREDEAPTCSQIYPVLGGC
jgi:hypothetical protein